MLRFFVRDSLLALAALRGIYLQPQTPVAHWLIGLLTGLAAYNFHEWSHFMGGRFAGAVMEPAKSLWSPFLFSFDSKANSLQQFHSMTLPGFIATVIYLLAFLAWLPEEPLWARVALGFGVGLASLTVIIEGPIALYSMLKRKIPVVEIPGFGNHFFKSDR